MALALYRKYRPANFAEVVGQDHVTEPLRAALAAGRINHAYLFSGPRGCGKTSSARILARSLNCEQGPTPDPCGKCPSCIALAPEGPGSIDVVELDAASHGGVDDARDLRDRAFYAPAESRYRVFIIDEAHMVTTQGFNALLKIVEEPPEHLVFVFATTEPEKVLPTIRSRTHHYPFRLLPPSTMRGLLEQVCAEEGVRVDPAVYPLVIKAGGGSARDSLSVMDQLLAGAGDEGVSYARAVALLGVTDAALLDEVVRALAEQDGAAVFAAIDRLVEAGHDPRRFASDLLQRFRDLLLLRVAPEPARQGLVDVPEDQLAALVAQAERLGAATLTRFAEIVHSGLVEMRGATSPRLLLELLCARMLLPAASEEGGAVLHRLERLERRLACAAPADAAASDAPPADAPPADAAPPRREFTRPSRAEPPAAPSRPHRPEPPAVSRPEPPAAPTRPARPERPAPAAPPAAASAPPAAAAPPATPPPAGQPDLAAVQRAWQQLLDAVREQSRATQVLLSNATPSAVEANTLILTLPTAPLARRLGDERNVDMIRKALRAVLRVDWQVQCRHDGGDGGPRGVQRPAQPAPRPRPRFAPQEPARGGSGEDVPPPPEPPEPDDPGPGPAAWSATVRTVHSASSGLDPADEEMLAEAAEASRNPQRGGGQVYDPEAAALELLAEHLGARPLTDPGLR